LHLRCIGWEYKRHLIFLLKIEIKVEKNFFAKKPSEKKTRTRLRVLCEDAQANAGWAVSSEIKRWKAVLATPAVSMKVLTTEPIATLLVPV
jgi:hypothetical protein